MGVQRDANRLTHVIFESKAGREAIACKTVIDCTGDADIVALAGEPFESERIHPWLWFRTANVDVEAAEASSARFSYYRTSNQAGYLHDIDATNPDDLTYAEVECRRLVRAELDRLRQDGPGFGGAYLAGFAATLGITESRRLDGRYMLSREDMDTAPFDDTIAVTGHWTKYGSTYNIPYRSLLPKGLDNLLVAGRCISVDHRTHHATKEIPACFATGEAAGAAAAMSLDSPTSAAGVDVARLRRSLTDSGVYLPA